MRVKSVVRYFALAVIVVGAGSLVEAQQSVAVPSSRVYASGNNDTGQLGIGFATTPSGPAPVNGPERFLAIDGGLRASAAISSTSVYTWGAGPALGYTSTNGERSPRKLSVDFGAAPAGISVGADHALLLTADGQVWSWGGNGNGQLGRTGTPGTPAVIPSLTNVVQVSAGNFYSLALDDQGRVWAWGFNSSGQLGRSGAQSGIVQVSLPPIQQISAGASHALALATNGSVWAWGLNTSGQTAHTTLTTTGVHGVNLPNAVDVSAGSLLSVVRDAAGQVWAFGQGNLLGANIGSSAPHSAPIAVLTAASGPVLTGAVSIAAGADFGVIAMADGTLAGFGTSGAWQTGSQATLLTTAASTSLTAPVLSVAAGDSYSFALTSDPAIQGTWSAATSVSCLANTAPIFTLTGFSETGKAIADVMLVLDQSGSMSAAEFSQLKQFAHNLVNGFDIGPSATRVGLVVFSTEAQLVLGLSDDKQQILGAIDGYAQQGGATCIGCGLNAADAELDAHLRSEAGRFIAVVTDGVNNAPTPIAAAAAHLAAAITNAQSESVVLSVGIGDGINTAELDAIASDITGVQTTLTADFNSLDSLLDALTNAVLTPASTNLEVQFDFGSAWLIQTTSSAAAGAQFTVGNGGHGGTWELPSLGGATSITFTLKALIGGAQPVPVSATYADDQTHAATINTASIKVTGCPATLTLAPASSAGIIGQTHTLTATLKDDFGTAIANRSIRFDVVSGPNFGTLGTVNTNSSGVATKSYQTAFATPGTDVIEAALASDATFRSNQATRQWQHPNLPPVANAGADQTASLVGSFAANVTLDGTGSGDDGERAPLTYAWVSNTGVTASGATPSVQLLRGTHTFTLTVFDGELSRTDTVVITVVDSSAPVITPDVNGTLGQNGWYTSNVTVTWTVTDPESGIGPTTGCGQSVVNGDTPGAPLTCSATNGAGASNSASVTIKRDATAPTLGAQGNIQVPATSANGATVPFVIPSAIDTGSGLAFPQAQCSHAPGTTFPLGDTIVTCTATDTAGNVATRVFTVSVIDSTPPDVLPQITGMLGLGGWYRGDVSVSWTVNDPQTGIASSTGCSPSVIASDTTGTTLTCTATNAAGGSRSSSVTIRRDATSPVVTTSGNLVASATVAGGANVNYAPATATDATSGVLPGVACAPPSGALFAIGATTVTCTAVDAAGNPGSASFTITVGDTTPPVIAPLPDLVVVGHALFEESVSWTVAFTETVSLPVTASCTPASGSMFPYATTPVSCTVTDAAGNASTAGFSVTVTDPTPPDVFPVIPSVADPLGWYHTDVSVQWTISDFQSGIASSTGCGPTTITSDTAGTMLTCSVTNRVGATTTVFRMIKRDVTPPVITPPHDIVAPATSSAGAVVTFDPATATDATSGVVPFASCNPSSESTFPIGQTTVQCGVADIAGNFGTATFTITVSDTTAPVITAAVTGTPGDNGWFVGPVQIVWTVTDPQSSVSTNGCTTVTVSSDTPGVSFTCSATSAGGTTSVTETVKIDQVAPAITTGGTVNASTPNAGGTVVSYAAATATDATSGVAGSPLCLPASGSNFVIGTTPVTCSVSDNAGHSSSASFNVIVTLSDSTPPSITPNVGGTLGSNGWYRSDVIVNWTVADGDSAISSSTGCTTTTISSDTASQTLTCTATSQGGTASASVTIKRDTTAPALTTSANLSVAATSLSGADVSYAAATATDAMSGVAGTTICSPASGSTFAIGTTTVNCSVSDNAGNRASKSFTVTVINDDDNEPGRMFGSGHVMVNDDKVQFEFSVLETPRGFERGRVEIHIKDGRRGHRDDDRFEARSVDDVDFSDAPDYRPGRNSRTPIDTVLFRGTGKWDRQAGYTYIVTTSDRGEPGRGRDTFQIEVRAPNGQVVFSGGGTLTDGNVQSTRVRHPWSWWFDRDGRRRH